MDITITRTLSDEQASAVQGALDAQNTRNGTALTPEQLIGVEVDSFLNSLTAAAYATAVSSLGEAAAKLPFANRQALIAQVKAAVGE